MSSESYAFPTAMGRLITRTVKLCSQYGFRAVSCVTYCAFRRTSMQPACRPPGACIRPSTLGFRAAWIGDLHLAVNIAVPNRDGTRPVHTGAAKGVLAQSCLPATAFRRPWCSSPLTVSLSPTTESVMVVFGLKTPVSCCWSFTAWPRRSRSCRAGTCTCRRTGWCARSAAIAGFGARIVLDEDVGALGAGIVIVGRARDAEALPGVLLRRHHHLHRHVSRGLIVVIDQRGVRVGGARRSCCGAAPARTRAQPRARLRILPLRGAGGLLTRRP